MKKIALAVVLACTLIPAASNAQVYVHIGPPVAVVEHPGPPPGRDFVWVSGYHRGTATGMYGCPDAMSGRLMGTMYG